MREFELASVDWDTPRVMQAGQLKQETHYLEELARWTLQRGRIYGLLKLADDGISQPAPEGEQSFSISVRGCFAVGEQGYLLDIPDDAAGAVRGILEARTATVPLYVGVAKVERAHEPELHPSVDRGLLHCGGLRRRYRLATDNHDAAFDWLQIAQFEKTTAGLAPSPHFIPECVFLSSHAGLRKAQREIQNLARQALETLERSSFDAVPVFAAASSLAGSLGPAACVLDNRLAPRAYVDRLAGVLAAQRSQLRTLPSPNLAVYQEALDKLDETLLYLDQGDDAWTMGRALALVRECFERLLPLYPALLQSLNLIAMPVVPTRGAQWGIAEPAPRPGPLLVESRSGVANEQTVGPASPPPADAEGNAEESAPPKRSWNGLWRR